MKDWLLQVPLELWYSLRIAFVAAATVFVFRLQKRIFRRGRQAPRSLSLRELSERTDARISEGVTYLQVLLWGLCVVDELSNVWSSHDIIKPSPMRFLNWLAAAYFVGLAAIAALDVVGKWASSDGVPAAYKVRLGPLATVASIATLLLTYFACIWSYISLSAESRL